MSAMSGGGVWCWRWCGWCFYTSKNDLLRNNQSIKNTTMQYDSHHATWVWFRLLWFRKKSKIISDQINLIFSGHSLKDNYMRICMYVPMYLTLCYLASRISLYISYTILPVHSVFSLYIIYCCTTTIYTQCRNNAEFIT